MMGRFDLVRRLKYYTAKWGRRDSFTFRMFKIFFALFFSVSLVFTLYFVKYQTEKVRQDLDWKGRTIASFLADSVRIGVFVENRDLLNDAIEGVMSQREVLSVAIYTADGKELLRRERPTADSPSAHGTEHSMEFVEPVILDQTQSSEEALYFRQKEAKSDKKTIGRVRVVLDSSILKDGTKAIVRQTIGITCLFLIIGTVVLVVAIQKVLKPLMVLTDEVKMMGEGKEIEKLSVESGDEIGKLADAFNVMTESLKKRDEEARAFEKQLRHSQKMDAVGTLARGIAHDFNNILTTVQASLYAMQKKISKEDSLYNYIFRMDNSVAKAKSLVQGLLVFGKGQGARSYPVDINAIIVNMLPTIEGMVGESITFEIMMPDKPLVVMADSVQMKQVVLNLVANARDAMPDGGNMTITLDEVSEARDSCIPRSGSFALVLIGDNGQGIDDKIKERIFEPFFTTKEVGKGTGLGLSIVYGIVEQHHGHICVNSKPGGGTEFRVYIPLAEVSDGPVQDIVAGG